MESMADKIASPPGSFYFDRRGPTWCDAWNFKAGDPFTMVGFNEYRGGPLGPHMPHDIPRTIPAHITLFLYYDSLDGASHYSGSAYTQEADEELFLEGDHTAVSELFTFMIYQMNGGQTT